MNKKIIIIFACLVFISTEAFARITVTYVKGSVAYKTGRNWKTLRTGMNLLPGTKISTGIRSRAVIYLNRHKVYIRPLTMIKIYRHSYRKLRSTTRIGLRRGSIRARVSRSRRIRTSFRISTPVATSSVRGTEQIVSYGPNRGMRIIVVSGVIEGTGRNGATRMLYGKLRFNMNKGKGQPSHILGYIRKGAIVWVGDPNLPFDEQKLINLIGDNVGTTIINLQSILNSNNYTNLNFQIDWP